MKNPLGASLSPQIGYQAHRFLGVSGPICGRCQLNADFFNTLQHSPKSICRILDKTTYYPGRLALGRAYTRSSRSVLSEVGCLCRSHCHAGVTM